MPRASSVTLPLTEFNMPFFSEEELLALSACPPSGTLANDPMPIDAVEERITLHGEALNGPVTYLVNLCCDELVAIGVALQKIERSVSRLVNKELKGTGTALAEIANYLKIIAITNVGENQNLLTQLQQQILFGPPAAIDRPPQELPPETQPFSQAPETTPAVDLLDSQDAPFGIVSPPELIAPPTEIPSFPPETSAAVGGETFAAPVPVSELPTQLIPGGKGPGFPLDPETIAPPEAIA